MTTLHAPRKRLHAPRKRLRNSQSPRKSLRIESLEQRQLLTSIDIIPGIEGSYPTDLTVVEDSVFFNINVEGRGQIWTSDGTEEGTKKVSERGFATNLTNVNGTLFFLVEVFDPEQPRGRFVNRQLWKTDGSVQGTVLVKTVTETRNSLCDWDACRGPGSSFTLNNKLYFTNHGSSEFSGDLWVSDGTDEGTVLLHDSSSVDEFIDLEGELFFRTGFDYWRTDGTPDGTIKVVDGHTTDAARPFGSSNVVLNRALYSLAFDEGLNLNLWKTDLDSGTIERIKEFNFELPNERPRISVVNGTLYLPVDQGRQLWKSDGTEQGTILVTEFAEGRRIGRFENVNEVLYFTTSDPKHRGTELWKTTENGDNVELVSSFESGQLGDQVKDLTNVNGTLYFVLKDPAGHWKLWRSNGTESGTSSVEVGGLSITPNWPRSAGLGAMSRVDFQLALDKIFFAARTDDFGVELVVLELSNDNKLVGDVNDDGLFNSSDLVAVFKSGEYDDGIPDNSTYDEGDWNGDGEFDSSDLVLAFQQANYSFAASKSYLLGDAAARDWLFERS